MLMCGGANVTMARTVENGCEYCLALYLESYRAPSAGRFLSV